MEIIRNIPIDIYCTWTPKSFCWCCCWKLNSPMEFRNLALSLESYEALKSRVMICDVSFFLLICLKVNIWSVVLFPGRNLHWYFWDRIMESIYVLRYGHRTLDSILYANSLTFVGDKLYFVPNCKNLINIIITSCNLY
jgi:hypothetical protein